MLALQAGYFCVQMVSGLFVLSGPFLELIVQFQSTKLDGFKHFGLRLFGVFQIGFQYFEALDIVRVFVFGQIDPEGVNDVTDMLWGINRFLEGLQDEIIDLFEGKAFAWASGVTFADPSIAFVVFVPPALTGSHRHGGTAMAAFEEAHKQIR